MIHVRARMRRTYHAPRRAPSTTEGGGAPRLELEATEHPPDVVLELVDVRIVGVGDHHVGVVDLPFGAPAAGLVGRPAYREALREDLVVVVFHPVPDDLAPCPDAELVAPEEGIRERDGQLAVAEGEYLVPRAVVLVPDHLRAVLPRGLLPQPRPPPLLRLR